MSRIALVTGASKGIGAAVARALAADGHRVAVCARSVGPLEALASEIGGLAVPMDVTDPTSVSAGVAEVGRALGPVEILVPNAGVAESAPVHKTSDALWERALAVNLSGAFYVARACVPSMVERGWGRIVFVASNAGLTGYAYTAAYCASKHGVVGLARGMAVELARTGVTVNCVCPGFVETDMTAAAIARIQEATGRDEATARRSLESMSPQRRLMQTDEVVHLVRTLAAEEARGVNGQAWVVDGGQVLN